MKMKSKRILPFVLLTVLLTGIFAGGQRTLAADTPLVVGVRDDIVNFGYLNETTGKYYGLEIDLAKELAQRLDRDEVQFVAVTAYTREQALQDGEVDCLIACYSINEERQELFVFFVAITIVTLYAILLLREEARRAAASDGSAEAEDEYRDAGPWRCHRRVGRKLVTVSAMGLLCILVISYYMQTLFSMSRASLSNTQRLEEVEMTIDRYQANVDMLTEQYDKSYVSKGETAAYILGKRPDIFEDRERLSALSRALGVEYIFVFDRDGAIAATDSPYTNFTLSDDPEEQSYEFRQLLQGVPYLIQPAQVDDVGVYRQYVGVTIRDENGDANGFVQVSVQPELLAGAMEQLSLSAVLQNIHVGVNGFAFAVDRDTGNFIYYPQERYIGRSAVDHGMAEDMFRKGLTRDVHEFGCSSAILVSRYD